MGTGNRQGGAIGPVYNTARFKPELDSNYFSMNTSFKLSNILFQYWHALKCILWRNN